MVLRKTDPARKRPFRTPAVYIIAPLSILGCGYLFFSLDARSQMLFAGWAIIGLVVYFAYSRSRSHLGRGHVEVHETEISEIEPDIPGIADRGRD